MTESSDIPAADVTVDLDEPADVGPDPDETADLGQRPRGGSPDPRRCAPALAVEADQLAVGLISALGEVIAAQRVPLSAVDDLGFTGVAMLEAVLHAAGVDGDDLEGGPGIGVSLAGGARPGTLAAALAERYRVPVRVLDEAIACTVAEHWRGAARGRRNVLGVMIGADVDGAVLLDGRLVRGTTGNAGRIGHVCVDPFGPTCRCGGRGCVTAVAGGSAIERWAAEHGYPDPAADAGVVAAAALRGEQVALATVRRAGEAIGIVAAGVVTLLDLDVVVVGGSVAAAGGAALFDAIDDGYLRHAGLDHARTPRSVRAVLGADAQLLGAAAAVLDPASYPMPAAAG